MNIIEYLKGPLKAYGVQELKQLLTIEINAINAKIYNSIYQKIFGEAVAMFNTYIDIYYSYNTKKYSRHETGVGSGTGVSLYKVEDFTFFPMTPGGGLPEFQFNFNTGALPGYKHHSNDAVWNIIANGGRGLPGKRGFQRWRGSYSGPLFSYSSHITEAYKDLSKSAEKIADEHFEEYSAKYEGEIEEGIDNAVDAAINRMFIKFEKALDQGVIEYEIS